ncbi:MAG: hypothetical protein AAF242_03340, partial [Bacteroidota bacterium]
VLAWGTFTTDLNSNIQSTLEDDLDPMTNLILLPLSNQFKYKSMKFNDSKDVLMHISVIDQA